MFLNFFVGKKLTIDKNFVQYSYRYILKGLCHVQQ